MMAEMNAVQLSVCHSQKELQDLFAFRYRVYVEEMKRPQKYANHAAKLIRDPLDNRGRNIIARAGDEIVGCVRVNFSRDGDLDYYERLLAMDKVGHSHPTATSLCTRLMVAPDYRRSTLAVRLACASFDMGLRNGIVWNFVDCNDHLVEFFTRLGYECTHQAVHEEYGLVNVMRLNILDENHLRDAGSVFFKLLRNFKAMPLASSGG